MADHVRKYPTMIVIILIYSLIVITETYWRIAIYQLDYAPGLQGPRSLFRFV